MNHYQYSDVALDYPPSLTGPIKSSQMRTPQDRRNLSVKSIWHSIVSGKRIATRRHEGCTSEQIIDTHEPLLLMMLLAVIALCISDAYMTILLMNNGAVETNPFMDILIEHDVIVFYWVKFTITSIGMMLLLIFKNFTLFKYISGYHLIILILSGYLCLLSYEFILLNSLFL